MRFTDFLQSITTAEAVKAKPIRHVKIAIDINSLTGITLGEDKLTPRQLIDAFEETGILVYRSGLNISIPVVIEGEATIIDVAKE